MGIFSRKSNIVKEDSQNLKESIGNVHNYEVGGLEAYNFVRGLRLIAADTYNNDYLLDRMMDDATISAAVDMYIDDALQVDPQKNEIFWISIDRTGDEVKDKLSKELGKELESFLMNDLRMDKELRAICRRYLQYGMCICRLDFIDTLEDDRLALIDKTKKVFDSVDVDSRQSRVINEVANLFDSRTNDLTESLTNLKMDHSIDYEDISYNEVKTRVNEALKVDKKKKRLNEDILTSTEVTRRLLKGRWSVEIIGQGTNIWELRAKGKTLAYMDVRKPNFLLDPVNLVSFSNNTGKYQVNFEVGPYNEEDSKKEYYTLRRGESYLDNARIAWQVLSALEDILMLTRMTRSILYRIFSVEVGNKGDTETARVLNQLKNRIKYDETINVKEKIYNSDLRQIPLGDSIFIPTRNGIGAIDIKVVGGDVNLKDAIDLDYFKDKLFAALRIPKAFLGFSDEGTGGMINTSLTRMDIRYARTIRGIQNVLASGLKDLCKCYLKLTRTDQVYEELPDFDIVFTSINTEEDSQRSESKKVQLDTFNAILDSFEKLGIDVASNVELRNELIKEYLGSIYLEYIDDNAQQVLPDKGGNDFGDLGGLSGGSDLGGYNPEFGPEEEPEETEAETEPTDAGENDEEAFDETPIGDGDTDFERPAETTAPSGLTRELR